MKVKNNKLKITRNGKGNIICKLWIHNWQKVKDTGITQYWECNRCRCREIIQYTNGGYQPIDDSFISGGM